MSERKVLNKYYPPDFDPSKIPRMKLAKNRQYTVRLMAPFNMRCQTCGEYIYKGKKFNARKEDVENETYLGIRIYRFYIKCTRCLQEISFKTDPQNTDYEIEAGATRNFMALKLAEEQAQREEAEAREEEASNPMKMLENRTKQSRNEIELLESLEELHDLNRRQQTIDYDSMLQKYNKKDAIEELEMTAEQEEEYIKSLFKQKNAAASGKVVKEEVIEISTENLKTDTENLKTATIPTAFDSTTVNKLKRKQTMPLVKLKQRATTTATTTTTTTTAQISSNTTDKPNTSLAQTNTNKNALSSLLSYSGSSDDSE